MPDKLDQYTDVLNRLVSETVACTPQEWSKGTLTIESDGTRINYNLKNAEQPGVASISEKLRDLIDELYVRMAGHGDAWSEATMSFVQEGSNVTFKTDFTYVKSLVLAELPKPRPRWKFL